MWFDDSILLVIIWVVLEFWKLIFVNKFMIIYGFFFFEFVFVVVSVYVE